MPLSASGIELRILLCSSVISSSYPHENVVSIYTYVLDWNEDLVVGLRVQKGRVCEVAELHLQLHSVLPEVTHALLLRQWFCCRVDLGYF